MNKEIYNTYRWDAILSTNKQTYECVLFLILPYFEAKIDEDDEFFSFPYIATNLLHHSLELTSHGYVSTWSQSAKVSCQYPRYQITVFRSDRYLAG